MRIALQRRGFEAAIEHVGLEGVALGLVEHDTAAALHAYRERMQLGIERWTLLRGGEDDLRELAALLGVNYRQDARGQFAHTSVITILNAEGEIAHQQVGTTSDVSLVVTALEGAAGVKR